MPRKKAGPDPDAQPAGDPIGRLSRVQMGDPEPVAPPADAPPEPDYRNHNLDGDDDDSDPLAELYSIIQGSEEPTVVIYRYPQRGPRELVDKMPALEFDPIELRNRWGPGRYQIRLQGTNGRLGRSKMITLAADGYRSQVGQQISAVPAGAVGEVAELRAMVRELIQAARPAPAPAFDASGLQSMMLAMSTAAASQATQLIGLFKEMAADKAPPTPPQSMAEVMEAMQGFLDIRERLAPAGDGGGDANPLGLLAPILPSLGRALEVWAENAKRGAGSETAAPARGPRALSAGGASGGGTMDERNADGAHAGPVGAREENPAGMVQAGPPSPMINLKPFIGHAKMLASSGAKAHTWGRTIAVQGGKVVELMGELYDAMGPDDFFAELFQVYPELEPYRSWCIELVESILQDDADLDEEEEEGEAGEG